MENILSEAVAFIRSRIDLRPKVALVLGSGMTDFANGEFESAAEISYSDVPGMAPATAPAHNGGFLFGVWCGVPVAVMRGRPHHKRITQPPCSKLGDQNRLSFV